VKFVRYLPEENYLPVVITGPGTTHNEWTPHDGTLVREIPESVSIFRIDSTVPKVKNKWSQRAERWLGFDSAFARWWIDAATELGERAIASKDAKLIYASMSPFASADVAAYLSKKHGIPWVADLRDTWAIDEIQVYPSFLHKKHALAKMHKLLSSASLIVMNTPEATAALRRAFPDFAAKRVVTITNGFDPEDLRGETPTDADSKFAIVHTGSFLTEQGLLMRRRRRIYENLGGTVPGVDVATRSPLILFEAIYRWIRLDPGVKKDLEIIFAGNAARSSELSPAEAALDKYTSFTGYLPRNESIRILQNASVLFLAMHDMPKGGRATSVPSKIYEYMASGRPILAAVPDGDAKDFLDQAGTALICEPSSPDQMISALQKLYHAWKTKTPVSAVNCRFLSSFDRRKLTAKLAREFDSVLGRQAVRECSQPAPASEFV
jgi:glycosyltransferase involved in cell wall biosynthesis